jgi:hypothetical protein
MTTERGEIPKGMNLLHGNKKVNATNEKITTAAAE